MGWNLERATATAGDIIADYYLPKVGLNFLSRHLALKDLDRRIDAYCEGRGGVSPDERKRLHEQLAQEFKQPRWDVYRFPRIPGLGFRLPFFASLNIGTSWARSWAVAGDTAFGVAYGSLPEEGVFAGWALAGLWAAAPHLPWTRNLGFIENGAYFGAMNTVLGTATDVKTKKTFYDNVQCQNKGPGSGGKKASAKQLVSEPDSNGEAINTPLQSQISSLDTYFGGENLADQIAKSYEESGLSRTPEGITTNASTSLPGTLQRLPVITPVRISVNLPRSMPATRAVPAP